MKLVINTEFGGFGLSQKAIDLYKKYIREKDPTIVLSDDFFNKGMIGDKIPRYDPCLLRVLQELGDETSDGHLTTVEIPDNIQWMIQDYDGYEWVSQAHKIYSECPLYNNTVIMGHGTESQEIYHPPSIYEKNHTQDSEWEKAIETCNTQ